MQTTTCVGLAFLPAKQVWSKESHHCHHKAAGASAAAPPVLIGGVLESKLVLAHRRLPCFSWSHRVRRTCVTAGASATATRATTPGPELLDEEGNQNISRNVPNFEPSVWGDFFLTYSSPLASSTEQVCFPLSTV